ncbi:MULTISPECIES: beta-ketoacyl-[acyl-carrier-protein] synthase family protein [Pseudomonas]|uniref:3-oxoacyl-[acyl-carrier-protein] synthase III n=2 Tax=Pseudomonas costantinii TaxID=168469 RepID=A0A1S2V709_9PSED|nr:MULTISPECIES: hypothetical protein [Pseudomonas]MCU1727297.1 hypothetical protein [Pseudomonas sp. 7P_10.2_Bac1]OIN54006.1 hypothetical protein BFL40_07400 [Pseudomonas costantinii]SED17065.1 3-oxoacyl-[acyl-carrier-protein] synthase III [Pseudomonas costantinii]
MNWIGIEAAAYYLPGESACVSHWMTTMAIPVLTQERILRGGHQRYYPGEGQSVAELCRNACQQLFQASTLQACEVDLIIHAHTMVTSVAAPPQSMVAGLARDLGAHRAAAFSVSNLHCGSMIGALRIIENLMATDSRIRNAVVVTADTVRGPDFVHPNQSYVHSDGAAAIWVRRNSGRNRVCAISVNNLSDFHMGYLITEEQRRRYDMTSQLITLRTIKQAIRRSGVESAQVRHLVPQNVSRQSWIEVARHINPAADFLFDRNIAEKGHACCSDIVINLLDGGFLDPQGSDAIVAVVRGTTGTCAAFVLHGVPLTADMQTTGN